jgi:hypothetical protein
MKENARGETSPNKPQVPVNGVHVTEQQLQSLFSPGELFLRACPRSLSRRPRNAARQQQLAAARLWSYRP